MNHGRTVFAQLLDFVPFKHFEYLVEKFSANHAVRVLPTDSRCEILNFSHILYRLV